MKNRTKIEFKPIPDNFKGSALKTRSGKIAALRNHPYDSWIFTDDVSTAREWALENAGVSFPSYEVRRIGTKTISWPAHTVCDAENARFSGCPYRTFEAGEARVDVYEKIDTTIIPWWAYLADEVLRSLG